MWRQPLLTSWQKSFLNPPAFPLCVEFPEGLCLYFTLWVFTPWRSHEAKGEYSSRSKKQPQFFKPRSVAPSLPFLLLTFQLMIETLQSLSTWVPLQRGTFWNRLFWILSSLVRVWQMKKNQMYWFMKFTLHSWIFLWFKKTPHCPFSLLFLVNRPSLWMYRFWGRMEKAWADCQD